MAPTANPPGLPVAEPVAWKPIDVDAPPARSGAHVGALALACCPVWVTVAPQPPVICVPARHGPAERPGLQRRGAGVLERDGGDEPALPRVVDVVGDRAAHRGRRIGRPATAADRRDQVRLQDGLLGLVDRRPVVVEDAAGVAGVGVPRPVREAHAGRSGARVLQQLLQPDLVARVGEGGAELAEQHRRDVLLLQVAEEVVPQRRQVRRERRVGEPRLGEHRRRVLVRRVDQLVRFGQSHRELARAGEVAAPPAALRVAGAGDAVDALDDDQPVGIGREDGVPAAFGGQPPVGRGVAAAPARAAATLDRVRLVVQVGADHRGVALVVLGEHRPVGQPPALRVRAGVPERGLRTGVRPVLVEDDAHALGARRRR